MLQYCYKFVVKRLKGRIGWSKCENVCISAPWPQKFGDNMSRRSVRTLMRGSEKQNPIRPRYDVPFIQLINNKCLFDEKATIIMSCKDDPAILVLRLVQGCDCIKKGLGRCIEQPVRYVTVQVYSNIMMANPPGFQVWQKEVADPISLPG